MSRLIAIGDIHGCATALSALIEAMALEPDDVLVTLGDYVDRGIDSRGVLDLLIGLGERCRFVPLLGNHDEMLLQAAAGGSPALWLQCGGLATLTSYAVPSADRLPTEHLQFLRQCRLYLETEKYFFVHGNYDPDLELAQQDPRILLWRSLREVAPGPHCSGKIAVLGHTPQREILDLGHLISIDTGCCYDGRLTALDLVEGRVWQSDLAGTVRRGRMPAPGETGEKNA